MNAVSAPTIPTANRTASARSVADWCFLFSWLIVAAAAVGWVFTLIPVWASKPDLADRFLIPSASCVIVGFAWPRLRAIVPSSTTWGLVPLTLGAAAFALGWYVAVQVSGRPIVVWWLTGSLILLISGLTLTHLGWRHTRLLLFPLLFILLSLPTPGRVYNPLMNRLQQFTTTAAYHVLPVLGVPVERPDLNSFELKLQSGDLGVVEACSGVRSVMALTAIAVLVAYLRGFGVFRGMLLVILTGGVIAVTNAVRVITTGWLQESLGRSAIEGWAHNALGVGVILIGLALIVGISSLIAPRHSTRPLPPGPPVSFHQNDRLASLRATLCLLTLLTALATCVWAEKYRVDHHVFVNLQDLPVEFHGWKGESLEVPDVIKDELMCDQVVQRVYQNSDGQLVSVHVMFWANAATTAHQHHPDICYPSRGWKVSTAHTNPLELSGGGELPISVRHYMKPEQQQVLFFWTQHGSYVLPDGIEKPELMSGHSWIFDLLKHGHQPIDSGARISVLIGTQTRGSVEAGERLLRDFTREFAAGLYELCPWARPAMENNK
jgi:EpsI family protein